MADQTASPSEMTLLAQLDSVRFICGVEDGKWERLHLAWPHLYVRVHGKDWDSGRVFTHDFRLQCDGYPDPGPIVERWTYAEDDSRGGLPPRPLVGSPGYIDAMKDWDRGIYRAWSRLAATHGDWATKRPDEAWNRNRDIVFIMEKLYALVSEQAVWLATHS